MLFERSNDFGDAFPPNFDLRLALTLEIRSSGLAMEPSYWPKVTPPAPQNVSEERLSSILALVRALIASGKTDLTGRQLDRLLTLYLNGPKAKHLLAAERKNMISEPPKSEISRTHAAPSRGLLQQTFQIRVTRGGDCCRRERAWSMSPRMSSCSDSGQDSLHKRRSNGAAIPDPFVRAALRNCKTAAAPIVWRMG